MQEPSPRTSRLAIAASLVAVLAVGALGFLAGRTSAPAPPPPAPVSATPPPPVPAAPPPRVLGRADLIALGAAASDATASALPQSKTVAQAPGQRFEMFLPFGCNGPAPDGSDAPLRWRYDEAAQALRIHVAPTVWEPSSWWQTPPAGLEAMEGFWVSRPWSSRETCLMGGGAAPNAGMEPITLPGQTLGLVQLVTADTPRQAQRAGKPYEITLRMMPEDVKLELGLRLRLRGRLSRFPDDGVARCVQPGGSDQHPICLLAVSLDEVAVENPATGEVLATWSSAPAER